MELVPRAHVALGVRATFEFRAVEAFEFRTLAALVLRALAILALCALAAFVALVLAGRLDDVVAFGLVASVVRALFPRFVTEAVRTCAARFDGVEKRPPGVLDRAIAVGSAVRNTDRCMIAVEGPLEATVLDVENELLVGLIEAGPKTGACPLPAANPRPFWKIAESAADPFWNPPLPTKPADDVRVIAYDARPYIGTNRLFVM